tara:strand:- start:28 stop:189 length:162 start_codon:yes stop_codon:yes gene_type:complete
MYETLEHWNQYKLEKLELELKQMLKENSIKEKAKQEMDKFIKKLITKNGITNY